VRIHFQILTLLSLALLVFSGCSDDGIGRSVLEVTSVNDGAPFVDGQISVGADQIANTADDFVPAGNCLVRVRNRPYNEYMASAPEMPFGAFVIDRISVAWQPLVAGTAADNLPAWNLTYDFGMVVPRGEEVEFNVMLVTFEMKEQPFLQGLITGDPSFTAQAVVTFTGHDSGATDTFYDFSTTIPVEFIGVIVD
jgi:hypothetical protein